MHEILGVLMLIGGGLFAGGAATFAWSRVPIWRRLGVREFAVDFEQTIRWTDKVQPALLLLGAGSAIAFAATGDGAGRLVAALGAANLVLVLLASLAVMVPLQRRIIAIARAGAAEADIDAMRLRWFTGNLGRSILSVASFVLLAVAAIQG